jgi:predicted nuclease of predicted toxin-antitoxin system
MKVKLDENMPRRLAQGLAGLGHDSDTVPSEGLVGEADDTVWKAAQEAGRFLITQDLDFSDARQFTPGTHCGVLLVRLKEPGREALVNHVMAAFAQEDVSKWERGLVVLTDRKLRVRRAHSPAEDDEAN